MSKAPIALEDRASEDGRLFSPSAGRNKAVIAQALSELISPTASVLEIGSGTGEHGIETLGLCPNLQWQFSDPDLESRVSQSAWISYKGYHLPQPLDLDVSEPNCADRISKQYDAIFSANMIHIAPISALEGVASLASRCLSQEGVVLFYGPFLFGEASAPSNLNFDSVLKGKNPAWGVRELETVKHIFAKHGFNQAELRGMPKNNHIFGLSRN